MAQDINLKFLGHSAWQITFGSYDILIDPFITGNPLAPVKADDLNPTHIILSHGHGDHLGDTVDIAKRSGAQVIAGFELANYLQKKGVEKTWGMATGGGYNFEFGRVKFTIAHHGNSAPDGTYLGTAAGILLTIDDRTIYHAGDTALFLDMKLIGERNSIDVALLPIGDNFTMNVDDAAAAVEFLRPAIAIPMHYNTFPPIKADPELFREKVEATGGRAKTLHPGESYTIATGS
jgi:L-ascorbate metabolism protein UlaG (beta-lactamase superfamily)